MAPTELTQTQISTYSGRVKRIFLAAGYTSKQSEVASSSLVERYSRSSAFKAGCWIFRPPSCYNIFMNFSPEAQQANPKNREEMKNAWKTRKLVSPYTYGALAIVVGEIYTMYFPKWKDSRHGTPITEEAATMSHEERKQLVVAKQSCDEVSYASHNEFLANYGSTMFPEAPSSLEIPRAQSYALGRYDPTRVPGIPLMASNSRGGRSQAAQFNEGARLQMQQTQGILTSALSFMQDAAPFTDFPHLYSSFGFNIPPSSSFQMMQGGALNEPAGHSTMNAIYTGDHLCSFPSEAFNEETRDFPHYGAFQFVPEHSLSNYGTNNPAGYLEVEQQDPLNGFSFALDGMDFPFNLPIDYYYMLDESATLSLDGPIEANALMLQNMGEQEAEQRARYNPTVELQDPLATHGFSFPDVGFTRTTPSLEDLDWPGYPSVNGQPPATPNVLSPLNLGDQELIDFPLMGV